MKLVKLALISCVMVGLLTACCWAAVEQDQTVPSNAKSAMDLVNKLKEQGITNIRSVEFGKNQWNVEALKGPKETLYQIDPKSFAITKTQEESENKAALPSNILGIVEVIKAVEAQGLNGIRGVKYDNNLWKVVVVQDGKVTKLHLDPIAGDILWKDIQPIKADDSASESKRDKVNHATKSRFMKNQPSSSGADSSSRSRQPVNKSTDYQNGKSSSNQNDSSTSSKNGSSTSNSKTYQPCW